MHVPAQVAPAEAAGDRPVDHRWYGELIETLEDLHITAPSLAVRRWASQTRYHVHTPNGVLLYSVDATDGSRSDYHYDEMGNVVFLTDGAGAVTDSYAYGPYGELVGESGESDNPFTYRGAFGVSREGETGLYYMRARYYDSRAADSSPGIRCDGSLREASTPISTRSETPRAERSLRRRQRAASERARS